MADRKALLKARENITDRDAKERAAAARLLPFLAGKRLALYVPLGAEADILRFLPYSLDECFVPRCLEGYRLEFARGDALQKGTWGILEPTGPAVSKDEIDVALIPLVGFDGVHRMGYGKGYYDRWLKDFKGLKIGLAFDEQETHLEPAAHDVDLDLVITPTRILHKQGKEDLYNDGL